MRAAAAAALLAASAAEPEECQPKGGVHRWQPQFHVIAPMFPGLNGSRWPGGLNDANAVFQAGGVAHIMHQCDGGPKGTPCGGGWEGPNQFVTRHSPCTCILKNSSAGRVQASHMFSGGVNASAGQCWEDDDANYLTAGHIVPPLHVPSAAKCCDACHGQQGCTYYTCIADPPKGAQTYYHSWGHVISKDLARWTRIADALAPEVSNYEHGADCDGSVSFPHGRDKPPIMLFGPGCGYSGPPDALGAGLGDAPVVGLATPANASDPLLTHWVKDPQNPLAFSAGSPPCSFAGRAWSGPKGEHWSMLCTANGTRARYTAPATAAGPGSALHGPWTLVDGDFGDGKALGVGGNSGPDFMSLPNPRPGGPTHILSGGAGGTYFVGTYEAASERFTVTARAVIDVGALGWTTAGHADDGRVLVTGWVGGSKMPAESADLPCPKIQGIKVCPIQTLSIVRVVSFEHESATLLAYPPAELTTLRNATLLDQKDVKLSAGVLHALPLQGGDAVAVDAEISFALIQGPANFSVTAFADPHDPTAGVEVTVSVGASLPGGGRNATLSVRAGPTHTFPLLVGEASLQLRVLIDRSIAEFFVAGGRAVYTTRHYPAAGSGAVTVGASADTAVSAAVHEMGCGWV